MGAKANGNLTTGQIVAGSATPSSTANHNKSYPSNTGYNQPFTGKPDAMTVWVKYVPGNAGDYARVNTVIHGNANYQDPENTDYTSIKYAQATLNYQAASGNGWQQLNIPFNVLNSSVTPAYILISFSTNKNAGEGTTNDLVYIDDVEFVYNSRLASLKVGGSDLSGFDKNTYEYAYTVSSLSSLPAVTATADGIGASVTQSTSDGSTTVTVKGNDYSSNPSNIHTYVINYTVNTSITASDVITTYGTEKALSVTTNNNQSALEYAVADPSIARVENGKIVPLKAGSTTLTISQKASKNYTAASKTVKITVNKAHLTVTANNATRAYGTGNPTFTLSYSGFVNNDTEASLTTRPTATCSATATSPAGTYDITVSGGKSDNYTFIYKKGTLTVTSAAAQITITPIGEKTYGDAAFNIQATSTNTATAITYTVADPTVATISNGRVTILKAGSTTITASQAASGNFNATSATTTLVVNKAPLTVTANDATRAFGEKNPTFTLSYSGFVNGDTEDDLSIKPNAFCNATTSSPVGTYDITVGGGVSTNYAFTYVKGTLTVSSSAAQIAITPIGEKTYGNAPFELQATSPNKETAITYTIENPAIASINGSTVTILKAGSTTITAHQAASGNYEEASATTELVVNKALLTVTADNASRSYGEENPALTFSYSGFVNGENESVLTNLPTVTCEATAESPAGSYDIVVSGGAAENYTLRYVNGTLSVLASSGELTFTAIGEKTYGDAAFDLQVSSPNTETPITFTVEDPTIASLSGNTVTILKAGKTTITAHQDASTNYGEASATAPLVVNKAPLKASANDASRAYGEANPTFSFSYEGFVNGDSESDLVLPPTATTEANPASPVGTYDIVAGGDDDVNYTYAFANATLTVEKAILDVTADDLSRTYGAENPTLTLSYSGFANGEDEAVLTSLPTLSCEATPQSPAGSYDITVSGGEGSNYTLEYTPGTLIVEKAPLTVTADDQTRSYGEENPTLTFTYSGFVNGEDESVLTMQPSASCEATSTSQAGRYDIIVSGGEDENYRFVYVKGALTVTASSGELTFTAIGEKTYGDAPFALKISSPNTETPITFSIEDESIATISDGTVTILKAGKTTISAHQAASTNFGEATTTTELVVNKAPLTIQAENKSRKYGEANPTLTLVYEGFVNGDNKDDIEVPEIACEATSTSIPGNYPITLTEITDERYAIETLDGELTIGKATLEVSCRNESSIVGQTPVTDFELYITGFVNGEERSVIDLMPTVTCEVTVSSPIGFYPLIISGGEDDCYDFNYTEGTYTVRSATLSKTMISLMSIDTKRYGDAPFAPTVTTNNNETEVEFVFGTPDVVEYKEGAFHILKSGTTTLKAVQKSSPNYTEGESKEITLTVEKAPLQVIAGDTMRIEGEENPAFVLSYRGFLNGDNASCLDVLPTASCEADALSSGGYYDIVVSGGEDDCYDFAQHIGGTLLVKGKTRITLGEITDKRYGDTPFTPSFSSNNTESPVRFEIADTTIARLENGKIVIVKSGTTSLKAYQEESAFFSAGESEALDFTIGKAPLSVSVANAVRIEGEENPEFELSFSGFINGEDTSCLDVLPTASCEADALSSGGYYDIVVSGGEDDCYDFAQHIGGTLLVKGKTRITLGEITDKRYGDTPFTPSFSSNNTESPVRFEIADTTIARLENGKIVIVKSGTTSLKAYQEESAFFSAGESEALDFTIGKAPLSVSVANAVRIEGEENPEFELSFSGFINGEDTSCLDVLPTASCEADALSSGGYYDIVVSGGEDDCYDFAQHIGGTLLVKGKTRITLGEITDKRYGDTPFTPSFSSNNTESPVRFEIADTTIARLENGKIVIVKSGTTSLKAYQEESAFFSAGESEALDFTIGKAPLSVSVANAVRIEGEENPEFELSFSGFINGEDTSCLDVLPIASCEADALSPGGYYDIVISGGEDDCYDFAQYVGGTLLVKGKTHITLDEISDLRYGDLPFAPTFSSNNAESLVHFEIADPTIADFVNGKIVIIKSGTTTLKAYQEESAFFSAGESEEITLSIEKAPLSVSVDNAVREEGEPNPLFTLSYSGFVNGDDASCIDVAPVAQCLDASLSSPAGYYEITVSGGEDDCYVFTRYISGTLVVTEASGLQVPTLEGVRIYLADKRLVIKGMQVDTVDIYTLNGSLAGRYRAGDIVDLPTGFYIARTAEGKACLQITE